MTAATIPGPTAFLAEACPLTCPTEPVRSLSPEIYRRRRLAVVAVIAGLILGIMSFGRQAEATHTPQAGAAQAVLVVVQPGDTLWAIAEALVPGADPRPLVDALGRISGGDTLLPGQLLTIPSDLLD